MPGKFCHNCGKQLPAIGNFCPFCGTSLLSLTSKPTNQTSQSTFTPFSSEEEDDDYIDKIQKLDIRIDKLEIEISKPNPVKETIGSVFIQGGGPTETRGIGPYLQVDQKTFLSDFQKEAGTMRQNEK